MQGVVRGLRAVDWETALIGEERHCCFGVAEFACGSGVCLGGYE